MNCQLAKQYNADKLPKASGYYITEKLDGNRCLAEYDGAKWNFYSRSGKKLYVNFDLTGFNTARIYDGEIMTVATLKDRKNADFNTLNGLIQRQYGKKNNLVYVVFDIADETKTYTERRQELNGLTDTANTMILPVLAYYQTAKELNDNISELLTKITDNGGEGLMINTADSVYQTKRTNALLKVKNTYTMDLRVTGFTDGQGKCNGMIGALQCEMTCDDGKRIKTEVGGGFDDYERKAWYENPKSIIGKIIEVAYFELTQNEYTKGTNIYSLRFPRYTRIRTDKLVTSEY